METLARAANRGSISTGPYQIDNSLKFERANNESVNTTNQAGGNRKTWTFSAWIKRTALSQDYHTIFGAEYTNIQIMDNNRPRLVLYNGTSYYADPEMLMRDTSAWYHIVVQLDTTQSTAADRVKWWINGERVTTFNNSTYTNMTQNTDFSGVGQPSSYGGGGYLRLGTFFSGDEGFDGYMADVYYLNGTAAEADDFGEFDEDSGIWVPKAYTGSGYGTQGFHYKFDNASNLGEDSSGEGHDANALSAITAADQATDTPTNNFCTLVSPQQFVSGKATTLVREGGTIMYGGQNAGAYSTMGVRSGKWYFESTILHSGGVDTENHGFGVIAANRLYELNIDSQDIGHDVGGWASAGNGVGRNNNTAASGFSYITSPVINKVLGCAIDMDNGKIWWHNEGTWQTKSGTVGNPANGTDAAFTNLLTSTDDFVLPAAGLYANGAGPERAMNFGGYPLAVFTAVGTYSDANGHGSFSYAPPTGYYALCTKNLAEFG